MKKFALLSVFDKTDIEVLAKELIKKNYEILATGNTSRLLNEKRIDNTEIADYTSFPEIFSGRVKTLHPVVCGGILMRRDNPNDLNEAAENNINPIDIVCVNLYPFPQLVRRTDIDHQTKIENIDVGGPSLIRAAAKNYKFLSVLTDPSQYGDFLTELELGEVHIETRQKLAAEAFAYTSNYDTLIADYYENEFKTPKTNIRLNYNLERELRYGENPHQKAFLYGNFSDYFEVLHGKELSYNNIIDLTAASVIVDDLSPNSCAIIKHTNPCGAATSEDIYDAYVNALSSDPVSAFGGIVAFNDKIDERTAEKLNEIFLEIIVARGYTEEAFTILRKKKNRRLIRMLPKELNGGFDIKSVPGGLIVQEKDFSYLNNESLKVVTKRKCTKEEYEDLKFAWTICKHTKSNAIVFVKDKKVLGVGAGQMSRIDSAKIAAMKAKENGHDLNGAVAASDAFFPFADGLIEIASNGIKAVIQPGGSVRDNEVVEAADEKNLAMIFTGLRNFKH